MALYPELYSGLLLQCVRIADGAEASRYGAVVGSRTAVDMPGTWLHAKACGVRQWLSHHLKLLSHNADHQEVGNM